MIGTTVACELQKLKPIQHDTELILLRNKLRENNNTNRRERSAFIFYMYLRRDMTVVFFLLPRTSKKSLSEAVMFVCLSVRPEQLSRYFS